jgi:signal transduction histidine kinase
LVFDLERPEILFCNRWARDLLAKAGVEVSFEPVLAFLQFPLKRRRPGAVVQPEAIRMGSRFFGVTVYYAEKIAWVFLRDITEKTRLEAVAGAVETTNSLGYVFSAVRHELGNPINSIKVALGVLQQNLGSYSRETIAEYVDRMLTEVARVERLLRSLRSFSAYERPQIERVELREFFADFIELIRPALAERGIQLVTDVDPQLAAFCDPRALHQVLLNLVTNASDALDGCADATIALRAAAADTIVNIRVEDNGAGIGPEQKERLFKPFSTTKAAGTGLGLVIARKLLAAMNGTIALESGEGRGTTVIVALPNAEPPASTRVTLETIP